MKVYCSKCVHFSFLAKDEVCIAPNNEKPEDTYKEVIMHYRKTPVKQNEKNDCPWYTAI